MKLQGSADGKAIVAYCSSILFPNTVMLDSDGGCWFPLPAANTLGSAGSEQYQGGPKPGVGRQAL